MRVLVMLGVLSLAAVTAAQEGAVAVPSAYTIQFENDWVKVTRVVYGPMAKLPPHAHTPLPSLKVETSAQLIALAPVSVMEGESLETGKSLLDVTHN